MAKTPRHPVVQRIKAWRKARDLSQSQAVRALTEGGVPIKLRSLQQWEIGARSPQLVTAAAIQRFLDEEEKQPPPRRVPASIILHLKRWREENNLSRAQAVAVLTDAGLPVKLNTLQRWENGQRHPSALAAHALQNFLDRVFVSEAHQAIKTQTRKPRAEPGKGAERNS